VVGESVQLKKAGTTFKGLCPFHSERTPSFVVTPTRESWHCFGCGKGGDLFSFVMEREAITFPEALRRLAGRAGVEIDERTSREDAHRKRLREVLDTAISFYYQVLTTTKAGQPALDYLRGRGFTDATLEAHQIGYAPDAWDATSKRLIEKRGFREEELEAVGLALRSQRRRGVYDRFRGRVIFPIRDASGGATGLGGRILDRPDEPTEGPGARDRGPKYLNTPATPLFDKSRTLYLIDRAKAAMRRSGRAILVEGNTDALMAHQQGFDNVVGTLGTALTPGQIELVTRYAPSVAMAYDVDAAGQSAATFGATELSALVGEIERSPYRGRLTEVAVVKLPDGRDPDEVMRDDPDVWRAATEHAQPIMEYLIERHAARHDPRTVEGRDRLVKAILPTLRSITDPVRRDGYLQLLARRSGVDERVLLETLHRTEDRSAPRSAGEGRQAGGRINLDAVMSSPDALDPQAAAKALEPVEATLLRLLLVHPEHQTGLLDRLAPDALITTPARELWRAIVADRHADPEGRFNRDRFLAALDPMLGALARTLYARVDPSPDSDALLGQAIDQCLLVLEKRRLDEIVEYKRAELTEAVASADDALASSLMNEVRDLETRRLELDRRRSTTTLLNRFNRNQPNSSQTTTSDSRTPTPAGGPA